MRIRRILAGIVGATMAVTMAGAVFAQDLNQTPPISIGDADANTQTCTADELQMLEDAGATVLWHFVLTSPSASTGHMDATFSDPTDSVTGLADTPKEANVLHWYVLNDSMTLESANTTDVTGGNFNLSHTCFIVAPTPTPTPTATPTLPPTSTVPGTPTSPSGTSMNLVLGLILLIAGGVTAYAMRPRRSTR